MPVAEMCVWSFQAVHLVVEVTILNIADGVRLDQGCVRPVK
jgi:hypothetical protein